MTKAFPGTSDDRTVEDVDRHIKEANAELPPLLTDEQITDIAKNPMTAPCSPWWLKDEVILGDVRQAALVFARAIESEVRTAIAAAGGGVPQANGIQRRAASLHIKTGMPWDEAEQLALSEAGINDEAIDELIGECGYSGLESLLTTPDELRRFTRSVLVHQPLASSPQPEAAPAVAQVPKGADFLQFLSDVTTAAGLLEHGRRDKGLAARIGDEAFRLRRATRAALMQVPQDQVQTAAWNLLHAIEVVRDARAGEENWNDLNEKDDALRAALDAAPEAPAQAAPSAGEVEQTFNIDAAARKLAECMDYPWEHMPEKGRSNMRAHARDVIDAALSHKEQR